MKRHPARQPAVSLLLLLLLVATLLHAADQPPIFSEIATMEAGLADITGLRFKHPVPTASSPKTNSGFSSINASRKPSSQPTCALKSSPSRCWA